MKNYLLQPAEFRLDGGAMFGIIPKPLWEKKKKPDSFNRINLALRLWLIETSNRLILIDTGIGDYHNEKFNHNFDIRGIKSPLENALTSVGFSLDDITDIVLSHLHFDHVGGLTTLGEDGQVIPVMPNARCHVHKKHYEYALSPTVRDSGSFQDQYFQTALNYYRDQNQLIYYTKEQGEYFPLDDGDYLRYRCSFGHTPWMMHPYNKTLIYAADLVPTSAHLKIPWVMGYDISPGVTTKDKASFFNFVVDNNLSLIYEHDDEYWGSSITVDKKGQWVIDRAFQAEKSPAHGLPC